MYPVQKRMVPVVGAFLLAGCAAHQYQPAPIVAAKTATELESRNLADPGLQAFEEKNVGRLISPWPPKTWDLRSLSLAAFYFNPVLDSARARVAEAEAAIVTAGMRPNPILGVSPGIPVPYLLTVDLAVPIETAGKRGRRVEIARSMNQAARFDLADSAWKVRSSVRVELLNYLLASRSLELLRSEEQVRGDQVSILEQRFSVGEIPRLEVDLARIELSKTRVAVHTAEGQVAQAKAALAAALGIPVAGLQEVDFSWPDMDSPPRAESLSPGRIQRDAVLNRLDVRRALAQYAAAEAALQLEIARQYPDIQLGPGYTYEERHSFFTIGFSARLPLLNRNQGPIAESEARCKQAAAAFLERQAQVIAESERALAVYTAALKELAEVESLRTLQEIQVQLMQQAIRAGAEDQLSLDSVQIQSVVIGRARLEALARAQKALGELEDAVQRPLDPGGMFTIDPESPARIRSPRPAPN